jgi:hypothetical protein
MHYVDIIAFGPSAVNYILATYAPAHLEYKWCSSCQPESTLHTPRRMLDWNKGAPTGAILANRNSERKTVRNKGE